MSAHSAEERKCLNLSCADLSALVFFAGVALIVAFGFAIYSTSFYELNPPSFGTTNSTLQEKTLFKSKDYDLYAVLLNVSYETLPPQPQTVETTISACIYDSETLRTDCAQGYTVNNSFVIMYRLEHVKSAFIASDLISAYQSNSKRMWMWIYFYTIIGSCVLLGLCSLGLLSLKVTRFRRFFTGIFPGKSFELATLAEYDPNFQITFAPQDDFIGPISEQQRDRQARELSHYIELLSRTARLPSELIYWHGNLSILRNIMGVYTGALIAVAIIMDLLVFYMLRDSPLLYLSLPIFAYTVLLVHIPIRMLFQMGTWVMVTNSRIVSYGRKYFQHYSIQYMFHEDIVSVEDHGSFIEVKSEGGAVMHINANQCGESKNALLQLLDRLRTGSVGHHSLDQSENGNDMPFAPTIVDLESR